MKASEKLIPLLIEGKASWYAEEILYGKRNMTSNTNKMVKIRACYPNKIHWVSFIDDISSVE